LAGFYDQLLADSKIDNRLSEQRAEQTIFTGWIDSVESPRRSNTNTTSGRNLR
jgi:hypothetical protein